MKLPKNFIKMLENKYVLYFVLFLAVTNVLGYLVLGNLNAVIFFILVGFLVGNFSKNMIIVLTVPLVLTSILMVGKKVAEGLENKDEVVDKVAEVKADPATAKATLATEHPDQVATLSQIKSNVAAKKEQVKSTVEAQPMTGTSDDEAIPATTTTTDGFQSDGTNKRRNNRIDYASTVEEAYGDLNKILGGDGIKRLTQDTQQLMAQQMQLADAMKSMTPLMEQAKGMLKGLDFKELGGLANLAKSFSGMGVAPAQE
jgi:cell division protein FtsB